MAEDRDVLTERTTVGEVLGRVAGSPHAVGLEAGITEIASVAARYPNLSVVAVVDDEKRLLGIIPRTVLLDELFLYIAPETFLRGVLKSRNVEELGRLTRGQVARNLMTAPVAVRPDDDLGVAFERMHEQRLGGLPVVDERDRLIGYLDQLQLMLTWLRFHR